MNPAEGPAPLPLIDAVPAPDPNCMLGALRVKTEAGPSVLPLTRVTIAARVAGSITEVVMTETFRNPSTTFLEAVYVFPLPGEAAVRDFQLRVGDRVLRGMVKERAEAQQHYQQAVEEGRRAALLEQDRDDIFTVQVGNLPPNEEVTVELRYARQLPFYEDGTTELRLPLVVAPHYIPGTPLNRPPVGDGLEHDTDVVPDASRITPPRLAPGVDPKVVLAINVEVLGSGGQDAPLALTELASSQHATHARSMNGTTTITLSHEDEPLDRDFILRWKLATSEEVRSSLLVYRDQQGVAYGAVSLVPPRRDGFLGVPRDVLFVIDRSGSMGGIKMTSATRACALLLHTLGPRDRFAIQAFDDRIEWLEPGAELLHAQGDETASMTEGNHEGPERKGRRTCFLMADQLGIARGEKYLQGIEARGGTELYEALGAAFSTLAARHDGAGRAPIVVLLTDGQVGDEGRVLARLQTELGEARVFTLGIDTAVNETILRRLAGLGGGTATFVVPGVGIVEALRQIGQEIGTPLMVNLSLDAMDDHSGEVDRSHKHIPDLFAGRAITVFIRRALSAKEEAGGAEPSPLKVRVRGTSDSGAPVEMLLKEEPVDLPVLAQLWARARVRELEDRFRLEPGPQDEIRREIVALAIQHQVLTRFTGYLVVDEQEVVNTDGSRRRVVQPVAMPARWEMPPPVAQPAQLFAARAMTGMAAPASPPPPMAASAGGATAPAFLRAMARVPGRAGKARPAQSAGRAKALEERRSVAASDSPTPRNREAVAAAVQDLGAALSEIQTTLNAGRVPGAESLEKARADLLKTLAASDIGPDCPLLQRFLRSTVLELLASLRTPDATPAMLLPLFARYHAVFEAACAEAAPLLSKTGTGKEKPFWESSV